MAKEVIALGCKSSSLSHCCLCLLQPHLWRLREEKGTASVYSYLLGSRSNIVSFSPRMRHPCQKIWKNIYLPETHTNLSATGGDKGIMSRKRRESVHLMGKECVLGVTRPPHAWKRGTADTTFMGVKGNTAVRRGNRVRTEFKSQPLLSCVTSLIFSFLLHKTGMLLVVMSFS